MSSVNNKYNTSTTAPEVVNLYGAPKNILKGSIVICVHGLFGSASQLTPLLNNLKTSAYKDYFDAEIIDTTVKIKGLYLSTGKEFFEHFQQFGGKTVNKHFVELIDEYAGRVKHYMGFDITVIPELKNTKSLSAEQQKQQEGELILKQLQTGDHVVLLDEHGKEWRSVEFSRWMEQKMQTVGKRLVFIIGGPYGFSPEVYARANEKLSLSKMTFSHQMVRLIFVEHLYRAMTIMRGEPYHHE